MIDEGQFLSEALRNMPCELELETYNDAIKLQARLNKYIRSMTELYKQMPDRQNPFENLEIKLVKPKSLSFDRRGATSWKSKTKSAPETKSAPDSHPDLIESPKDSTPGDKP